MVDSLSVAIVSGTLGLLSGVWLPAATAYSILFVRRQRFDFARGLRLGGRLLLGFLLLGAAIGGLTEIMVRLARSATAAPGLEENAFLTGGLIGLWGGIAALVIGIRRARRRRTAIPH